MARIRINDLPQDIQVSKEEMKKVFGGLMLAYGTRTVTSEDLTNRLNYGTNESLSWIGDNGAALVSYGIGDTPRIR